MKLAVISFVLSFASASFAFDAKFWLSGIAKHENRLAALKAQYRLFDALTNEPASDISIPVETFPSGAVKTLLQARRARFQAQSDYVWGEKVKVLQFAENGATQAVINASTCVVDRKNKLAWCKGLADASFDNNFLEGEGVFLSMDRRFLHIFTDAFVKVKGVKLDSGKEGEISLESKSAVYDQQNGVVMFDKEVNVSETGRKFSCDKAYAFIEGTNSVKKVVAVGNVRFSDGLRTGSCPFAVYDRQNAKIEMFSNGGQALVIQETGRNKWKLEGEKMVFWIDSEQVEVVKSVITASDMDKDALNLEGLKNE